MMIHQLRERPLESGAGLLTMALGLAVYFVCRQKRSRAPQPSTP